MVVSKRGVADALDRKVDAMIEDNGYAVVSVLGSGGPSFADGFAYTVGLTRLGLPELAIAGLPPRVGPMSLACAADWLRSSGPVGDGHVSMAVFAGVPAVFRKMSVAGRNRLLACVRRYGSFEAMIVCYPDVRGTFPWESGCDPLLAEATLSFGALSAPQILETA